MRRVINFFRSQQWYLISLLLSMFSFHKKPDRINVSQGCAQKTLHSRPGRLPANFRQWNQAAVVCRGLGHVQESASFVQRTCKRFMLHFWISFASQCSRLWIKTATHTYNSMQFHKHTTDVVTFSLSCCGLLMSSAPWTREVDAGLQQNFRLF